MENATEALKMAFAVLVFVIAMSLGFMLISQARSTADVVFSTTDKQEYVNGITSMGQVNRGENYRTVKLDTIIPVLYRYAQENYGVTILDKNKDIVALYDVQVEETISSISTTWGSNEASKRKLHQLWSGDPSKEPEVGQERDATYGIKTYIKQATDININKTDEESKDIFKNMYSIYPNEANAIQGLSAKVQAIWGMNPASIKRRIDVDLSGKGISFNTSAGQPIDYYRGVLNNGMGMIEKFKDSSFKEYYYTVKEKNNITQEEETSKLQIIYVEEN